LPNNAIVRRSPPGAANDQSASHFTARRGERLHGWAGWDESVLDEHDPAAARRRAEPGRDHARVEAWQESSGNMGLTGPELPAGDAIAADKRVTAIGRRLDDGGAPGTIDQLRAAVFVALLAGRDPASVIPQAHADSPESTNSGPGGWRP